MKKNSIMRYIDSCVSNIARKIQDEFDESKHPRDKGGKFTSKGGEGTGGAKEEASASGKNDLASKVLKKVGLDNNLKRDKFDKYSDKIYEFLKNTVGIHWYSGDAQYDEYERGLKEAAEQFPKETEQLLKEIESGEGAVGGSEETSRGENTKKSTVKIDPETEDNIRNTFEYDLAAIETDAESEEEYIKNAITHLQWTLEDTADTDERARDNYGADAKTVAAVVNKMIEEFKGKKPEGQDMGYEEQEELDEEVKAGKETDKIVEEFEEGLDVVKQDADSDEEYRQKAGEYLSWALDATAKTDEQAMENYGVSSKVVADIVNKLRENLGSSSHYTETPEDKGKKQLESALKGWWTRADEMVEDLKDAGYEDVDYVNDELMYVSKDGVDYRVSLDKAGRTITAKRVEIV